jgi:leucyl aminopeptidase (aminopeptidase T)
MKQDPSSELKSKGAVHMALMIGLKPEERVLILTDRASDSRPLESIASAFIHQGAKVELEHLPVELEHDFPEAIRNKALGYEVILLAASQSWYQAPSRRELKYKHKKRVFEYYGITPEILRDGALCADYKEVEETTLALSKKFSSGDNVRITSADGTDFSFTIRSVYDETGIYDTPGSGGNLPAGEVSFGLIESTASGIIVFNISFDYLGRLERHHLTVEAEKGKVITAHGEYGESFQKLLEEKPNLGHIAEVGLGTNRFAILGRTVLEDEKSLGTVHVGLGNDTYFGGITEGPHIDGVFSHPAIMVNGKEVRYY